MKKPAMPSRPRKRRRSNHPGTAGREAAIATTLEGIDQIDPKTPKAAKLIGLLKTWLKDGSGYDEQTWPKLKAALNDERQRVGASRLFDE